MTTHANSANARLKALDVGASVWIETTLDRWPRDMSAALVARSRRSPDLAGREFSAGLFTAVSAQRAGDIRYVIRLERTA